MHAHVSATLAALFALCAVLTGFGESLQAQDCYRTTHVATGELLATLTTDVRGNVTEQHYYADGQLQRRVRTAYDDRDRPLRVVSTLYDDHEYDLIKEYTYEGERLVHQLYGNNRSGRWGSEGYAYDAHGQLATTRHYRKDGSLAYETRQQHTYDGDRLLRTQVTKFVLPADSLHDAWENEVALGRSAIPDREAAHRAQSTINYSYDVAGRLTRTEVTDAAGTLTLKLVTAYLASGGRRETSTLYEDGEPTYVERLTYDAANRLTTRDIGGTTTRYRYFDNGILQSAGAERTARVPCDQASGTP